MGCKFTYDNKQMKDFLKVIELNKNIDGPLMPILHAAQNIFGCIPLEIQKIISEALNISVSKINGVVTFYSHFSLEPKGKHHVCVCLGTACYVRGAQDILDIVSKEINVDVGQTSEDGKFSLEATRCVGACGLAPVITIGDQVYGKVDQKQTIELLKKYKSEGDINETE